MADEDQAWRSFHECLVRLDERDHSDAAREFASDETGLLGIPENRGEFHAALEFAFEAGRIFERKFRAQESDGGR